MAFKEDMTINNMYVSTYIAVKGKEFMEQHEKKARMEKDFHFFIECVYGRKVDPSMIKYSNPMPIEVTTQRDVIFGNCKAATPVYTNPYCFGFSPETQEKGNNPMRIENTSATAYVTAPKSDDATSRDYLLSRLAIYDGWRNPKLNELSTFFNLGEDGRPKTYLQLIDAIKNDKFSLDDKAVKRLKRLQDDLGEDDEDFLEEYGCYGPFYGIVFNDLPKSDRKGYDAAVKELEALTKATKDTIMVKSPADGLAALQALEAWTPAGKAN